MHRRKIKSDEDDEQEPMPTLGQISQLTECEPEEGDEEKPPKERIGF